MAPWSAALTVIDLRRSVFTSTLDWRPGNLASEEEECNVDVVAARKKVTQVLACRPASGVKHDRAAIAIAILLVLAMVEIELQTLIRIQKHGYG